MVTLVLSGLLLIAACDKDNPLGHGQIPDEPEWSSLGFENHWAIELELDWPYLYACAADEGLFRLDLEQAGNQWEYIGLADTSLSEVVFGHYGNRGVQDVAVLSDGTLLAGIKSGIPYFPGLYRSDDGGETWRRSDEGVADSSAPYASKIGVLETVQCGDGAVIAAGDAVYRSENEGLSWSSVSGAPGGGLIYADLKISPMDCDLAWAGGETAIFIGFLDVSRDGGGSWREAVRDFPYLPEPIISIALSPFDPLDVIVCTTRSAVRSRDGGESWQDLTFDWAPGGKLSRIAFDDARENHFFASLGNKVYETWDDGATADTLQTVTNHSILDLVHDSERGALYAGTWAGIFRYGARQVH